MIEYTRIRSKNALRPASSTTVAVIRTDGTLAGNTLVPFKKNIPHRFLESPILFQHNIYFTCETVAEAAGAIANAFVGALDPRMEI